MAEEDHNKFESNKKWIEWKIGKLYCYIFPLKMYGYILESRVVGEPILNHKWWENLL